ncbi:MAG TPA: hypothetical protein VG456_08525 [Candidatus Sulfopaludibacter sp.]|jgi:hypothetical protein|nr:hypothetical protein [Candidatus Sulfopaludibacter sp.]
MLPWRAPALLLLAAIVLPAVTPLPVGALLQHPAHYFDLAHQRLRLTPRGAAQYDVTAAPFRGALENGTPLGLPTDPKAGYWRSHLPFAFPFAGQTWDEVYINVNGSLTFGGPENTGSGMPDTWPDGTIRSLASSFDVDSIAGKRRLIVPLWGLNSVEKSRISTSASRGGFVVTWRTVRQQDAHQAYTPLGESLFQARLSPDGSIEFRYGSVAEKDGITGIFPGPSSPGKLLDRVELPPAPGVPPSLDLRLATLTDEGADLHFSIQLAGAIPATSAGHTRYVAAAFNDKDVYGILLDIDSTGRKSRTTCVTFNPQDQPVGHDCTAKTVATAHANIVDFYLPKIGLKNSAVPLEWKAETFADIMADPTVRTGDMRSVSLPGAWVSGYHLHTGLKHTAGNIYEIFHYPFLAKSRQATLQNIYQRVPADAEFAMVLTDFRIDDIHNAGSSNGSDEGDPSQIFNSPVLLQTAGPVYMGPQFAETVADKGRPFHNYPYAVGWMAHEMTHRWVATLKWKPPDTEALVEPRLFHWSMMLNTSVVTPVWKLYSDTPYPEQSIMGGMTVVQEPGGRPHGAFAPWGVPTGLCSLDLYQMGLIPPEEVTDTFFIAGAKETGVNEYQGGSPVPVTIAGIVEANGPRAAIPHESPHDYRLEIYLLHEDGRPPDPAKLADARRIQAAVAEYFRVATNGRMTIEPLR